MQKVYKSAAQVMRMHHLCALNDLHFTHKKWFIVNFLLHLTIGFVKRKMHDLSGFILELDKDDLC